MGGKGELRRENSTGRWSGKTREMRRRPSLVLLIAVTARAITQMRVIDVPPGPRGLFSLVRFSISSCLPLIADRGAPLRWDNHVRSRPAI